MVQAKCRWNSQLSFTGEVSGFGVSMDANSSENSAQEGANGPTPKQLALLSILGCTSMDVVSLLKKYNQNLTSYSIDGRTETTEKHPKVFEHVHIVYKLEGEVSKNKVIEAVQLSMTKYCGVSAMFSKAVPISYSIELNGEQIANGIANF